MWEAYQTMKWLVWQICHCCQAWLNCTSGEIYTAITGRSSSLLGTLDLLCERLIKQWNVILNMSLLPSIVELHQWWDIYCYHWSKFFTARNIISLMWEAYQAMKRLFWVCCQALLNWTSGEIYTAITGRSSSLLGTLVLLCERLIKQWNSVSEYVIVA